MLDLTFWSASREGSQGAREYNEAYFRKILDIACYELGLGGIDIELSLSLVGPTKMRTLNKKYRHKDEPTDVLSFPLQNLDNPSSAKTGIGDILSLGDIFISLEVARQKATEAQRTLDAELKFLAVHGFLHLLGYDHERSAEDETTMFDLQDHILDKLT